MSSYADAACRKIRFDRYVVSTVSLSDNMSSAGCNGGSKFTDWFVQNPRAKPCERCAVGIVKQIAAANAANADFVVNAL